MRCTSPLTPFVGLITQEVSPLNIGHRFRLGDGIYKGLIDDVRIYDNALSAAEISGLATATGTTPVPEPSTAVLLALGLAGLVGLYCRKDKMPGTLG